MRYSIDRHPSGAIRVRVMPVDALEIGGVGEDAMAAAERALATLEAITESPLGFVIPPGTKQAAALLRNVVSQARKGNVEDALKAIGGKAQHAARAFVARLTDIF